MRKKVLFSMLFILIVCFVVNVTLYNIRQDEESAKAEIFKKTPIIKLNNITKRLEYLENGKKEDDKFDAETVKYFGIMLKHVLALRTKLFYQKIKIDKLLKRTRILSNQVERLGNGKRILKRLNI